MVALFRKGLYARTLFASAMLAGSCSAFAGNLPIVNSGFEDTPVFWYGGVINGWSTPDPGNASAWNVGPASPWNFEFPGGGYGGDQVGYVNAGDILIQDLLTPVQASTTYTLSTLYGSRIDGLVGIGAFALLANGTVVATDVFDGTTLPPGTWSSASASWTSTAAYVGDDISVEYYTLPGTAGQIDFDNASLSAAAAVPGPGAACVAFGIGLSALLRRRRAARRF